MPDSLRRKERQFGELAGPSANVTVWRNKSDELRYKVACRHCYVNGSSTIHWSTARGPKPSPQTFADVMHAWIDHWVRRHDGEPLPPICEEEEFRIEVGDTPI